MDFLKQHLLLFVIFLTGAAVLIIEVVAIRILSPYFGNTIFTASSVIGVILGALSLGYWWGGQWADRHPSLKWFYGIILLAGISVFFLQFLVSFLLPSLSDKFSITLGPIFSAIILFLAPGVLLGTLSPFAIKLQKLRQPKEGIGKVTGRVFFWSTLGSIFGSFAAGFILIPHLGVDRIILGTGILLTFLGFLPLVLMKLSTTERAKVIALVVLGLVTALFPFSFDAETNAVYSKDGIYEKIVIFDKKIKERKTRFFLQDRSESGAMFLDSSEELVFDYTKYFLLYQVFTPEAKETLVLGGGAYSIPKAILKQLPEARVDVVEIEPSLFELSKKYFRLPQDPRLKNHIADGRRWLHDSDKKYDLIFGDVYYSLYSMPIHLVTQEFFQLVKEKLNKEGIFVVNLIGDLDPQKPSLVFSQIRTFRSVFPNSYLFASGSPKSMDVQNLMLVGWKSEKQMDLTNKKITGHPDPLIRDLNEKLVDLRPFDLSSYFLLTDNFAPVEYLTAKMLSRVVSK